MNATLLFPDYATAVASAKALGFWDNETDTLRTGGQSFTETGVAFSWAIDEIGQDPAVVNGTYDDEGNELTPPLRLSGYAVNVTGDVSEAVLAYAIPYGSAGRVFSGSGVEPHHYEPIQGRASYVQAVADPVPDGEP